MGARAGARFDRLIEYEALINYLLTASKSTILCQYNHSRFDSPCIHDVFRTHPLAFLSDQVCRNSYYESPEMVLSKDQAVASADFMSKRVDWWIAQLQKGADGRARARACPGNAEQTERRFAEAQQVARIGSWERDLRTNQVTWSNELYRLFDVRPVEIDLSYEQFLKRLVPQDVERIRALVDEAIREPAL